MLDQKKAKKLNKLSIQIKNLEKDQKNKPKNRRMKKTIAEIDEIESKNTLDSINKA